MRSPMRHYSRFLLLLAVIATTGCVTSGVNKSAGADPDAANQQHIRLALSYISSNNRDLARVHLEKAKALNPRSVELYNGYALLYQMEQEFELAERYYRKALAADSDYTLAHYNYSAFLFNQGRMAEALEQMQLVTQDLGYERRPRLFIYWA